MWNAQRNQVYHERCKNFAVAAQNLAEEAARLRTVFVQQLQDPPLEYTDTEVATVGEINIFQSYLADFLKFHNGWTPTGDTVEDTTLSNTPRGIAWTLPLIDREAA